MTGNDSDDYIERQRKSADRHITSTLHILSAVIPALIRDLVPWSLVKSLRCDQLGVSPLKAGDILHSDPKMKAEILNRQFVSAFTAEGNTALPEIGASTAAVIDTIHVSCKGVTKLLRNLKSHKAIGPDGIPIRLLKEAAAQIAPAVTHLFQASLNQGKVPLLWKEALVVPVFKKGNRS